MATLPTLLVIDDEVRSQEAIRRTLDEEFGVLTASSAEEGRAIMERERVNVVLCDHRMPGVTGIDFLKEVRERWPDAVRMIISGYTDVEDIIAGINDAGIYQYILKPWHPESLLLNVRAAAQLYDLQQQSNNMNLELRTMQPVLQRRVAAKHEKLRTHYEFARIVRSAASPLNGVIDLASRVATCDIAVHISGESGSGKELLGRAIHYSSTRAARAFVIENCGAMSDQLLESELFGHKRGSFTGAFEDRIGLFEQADGGTIFLDEIGDTSPSFQVKLLRVLQEGEIRPVGSSRSRKVDVRVLSATNRDLEEEVRKGRFREDLYYRLTQFVLPMPALRERTMDIPLIALALLREAAPAMGKEIQGFTPEALDCMASYQWPGNVREMQNEILRAILLCDGEYIGAHLFSPKVLRAAPEEQSQDMTILAGLDGSLKDRMDALEARVLRECLIRHRWNKTRAATELGLSRVGLRSKLARYGMEKKGE
ncbi:MAG: sigma-54 dependent transcriptional regulator [Gammaproteobacteria bacterium]|nr:sigma-54 dependent transcriptional regulator [Gammaproteobacteria bacterium]MBU1777428.1 sigma-54 dependent transcriptional regulator [Gammaproteobacteria bacterium]MBU1969508.1 sigma-54 dependent transcriptional regulator [Gammaproteobacteria bacterium]